MKSRLLRKVAKSQKYQILTSIKKSQGLSVAELCKKVGLSYMGVKQHCISLEKDGYLDAWRRPKGMGRPEKAYRLTPLAQEFFPTQYTDLTAEILTSSIKMYGNDAADKILFLIYQALTEDYLKKIKATDAISRAQELTALREQAGYMAEVQINPTTKAFEILEYNSPVIEISDRFPIIQSLEQQLFQKVMGYPVKRSEERISGLYRCTFEIDAPVNVESIPEAPADVAVA
ncbi:MAG: winged helix-turn-helix transcriptional regulator [Verrucomicrobiota bacterium]|nr:winged helix-turn-helix transcriptional regulator [Verrucomicrobiota bacterium]